MADADVWNVARTLVGVDQALRTAALPGAVELIAGQPVEGGE